jgi:hypothetical protein
MDGVDIFYAVDRRAGVSKSYFNPFGSMHGCGGLQMMKKPKKFFKWRN